MGYDYEKNVNKLQNAVIKENAANLVGAVKLYNALFANGADLKAICKALEIPAEYAVKVASLAKDKNAWWLCVAKCYQKLMIPLLSFPYTLKYIRIAK